MYDALTPLFDRVTDSDMLERLQVRGLRRRHRRARHGGERAAHGRARSCATSFNVPHVKATTHDGGVWAAGWIAAEDRGLLLAQARNDARVAASTPPGLDAFGLDREPEDLRSRARRPSGARQAEPPCSARPRAAPVLHDIDTFVAGINAYRADDEHRRRAVHRATTSSRSRRSRASSSARAAATRRAGRSSSGAARPPRRRAGPHASSTTCASTTTRRRRPRSTHVPLRGDPGDARGQRRSSTRAAITPSRRSSGGRAPSAARASRTASNELMVDAQALDDRPSAARRRPADRLLLPRPDATRSTCTPRASSGAARLGPVPRLHADRPRPGLRHDADVGGRGHHRPVRRDALRRVGHQVPVQGQVPRLWALFNAGTLTASPTRRLVPHHRPRPGRRLRDGQRHAASRSRASARARPRHPRPAALPRRLDRPGQEPGDVLQGRRASRRRRSTRSTSTTSTSRCSRRAACRIRPTERRPGAADQRQRQVRVEGLPVGQGHPHGTNPQRPRSSTGTTTSPRGFGAADDEWMRAGADGRVDLLNKNLERLAVNGKQTLASVTSAMNAAATQDVRAVDTVPLLVRLLARPHGAEARGQHDARPPRCVEQPRRQPPGQGRRRQRSTTRAPRSWTASGTEPRRRGDGAGPRARNIDELRRRRGTSRPVAVRGLVPVHRQGPAHAARRQGQGQVQQRATAAAATRRSAARPSGTRSSRGRRSSPRSTAARTPPPGTRTSNEEQDHVHSRPAGLRRCAGPTGPSGIQQVISFKGHR